MGDEQGQTAIEVDAPDDEDTDDSGAGNDGVATAGPAVHGGSAPPASDDRPPTGEAGGATDPPYDPREDMQWVRTQIAEMRAEAAAQKATPPKKKSANSVVVAVEKAPSPPDADAVLGRKSKRLAKRQARKST